MNEPNAAPAAWHRYRWWIIAGVLAALIALIVFHLLRQSKPVRAIAAQVVSVATTSSGDMPVVLNELGTVTPVATVTVLPQLSGYLTEVGYHAGEEITKGQFLAQIDPSDDDKQIATGTLYAQRGNADRLLQIKRHVKT
ncbi:biotin/lipoyl-binding protein [Burkholderia stabilis]|uniref:biotin/lipoyl-binding protein n=1 Tax=Burkholderia stabilis TaxID=95485 RepID=UPI00159109C8